MCGIIACLCAAPEPVTDYLLQGLTLLKNRGYDSAGLATIVNHHPKVTKFASTGHSANAVDLVATACCTAPSTMGIGHTRWATHGPATDANAHPHTSGTVVVVHNGVIENVVELATRNHVYYNDDMTDTQVVAEVIHQLLTDSLEAAVTATVAQLEGTWALVVMTPTEMVLACKGSPLVIGFSRSRQFVASEPVAFARYTREYLPLPDSSILTLTHNVREQLQHVAPAHPVPLVEATLQLYSDWTLKEIMEQPVAIRRTLNHGGRLQSAAEVKLGGLDAHTVELVGVEHLVITGCGSSLYAAQFAAGIMRQWQCFQTVQAVDAAELCADHFTVGSGLLALSQSGETRDVMDAVYAAQSQGIMCFSVVNQVGSQLARLTGVGVYLNAGRENAVAATKSFSCQVTALALIGCWFAQQRSRAYQHRKAMIFSLRSLPHVAERVLRVPVSKALVNILTAAKCCFILGRQRSLVIAREAALKMMELTYIPTAAFSGGALKHGPFAVLSVGTPVILLCTQQHRRSMTTTAAELLARGARVIVLADSPLSVNVDYTVTLPENGQLTELNAIFYLQRLAREVSLAKGISPDTPRHIAKCVTTG